MKNKELALGAITHSGSVLEQLAALYPLLLSKEDNGYLAGRKPDVEGNFNVMYFCRQCDG